MAIGNSQLSEALVAQVREKEGEMSMLEGVSGRVLDCDSHEMYPARKWVEVFGPGVAFLAELLQTHSPDAQTSLNAAVDRDDAVLSEETAASIWGQGSHAPGAFDMRRRIEMMDFFGIDKQLVFPSGVGLFGLFCLNDPPAQLMRELGLPVPDGFDLVAAGRMLATLYNDWCIETAKISPRLRPVAIVDSTTMEGFMAEAERVVAGGVRAIGLANGVPPDGKSPGHPDLDPMWRFFTDHKIPLLFHGGGDFGIWRHYQWINYGFDAEQWGQGSRQDNPEILDPYTIAQLAVGMQNFLTTMVYGGVFERHPDLHVGCIEMSGGWIGPMAENMDVIADLFPTRLGKVLSTKPSEYIQRNVRVSAYFWEPVDKYIERYELDNVFVFASDYPHWEGGKDPVNREAEKLRRLGSTMLEKFFVSNPSVLMA